MCVCECVHTHAHVLCCVVRACMRAFVRACVCTCCMHLCMCVCMYIRVCTIYVHMQPDLRSMDQIHVCACACVPVCVCVCVCVHHYMCVLHAPNLLCAPWIRIHIFTLIVVCRPSHMTCCLYQYFRSPCCCHLKVMKSLHLL